MSCHRSPQHLQVSSHCPKAPVTLGLQGQQSFTGLTRPHKENNCLQEAAPRADHPKEPGWIYLTTVGPELAQCWGGTPSPRLLNSCAPVPPLTLPLKLLSATEVNTRWLDRPILLLFLLLSLSPTIIPVPYWIHGGKLDWLLFVNGTQATYLPRHVGEGNLH